MEIFATSQGMCDVTNQEIWKPRYILILNLSGEGRSIVVNIFAGAVNMD